MSILFIIIRARIFLEMQQLQRKLSNKPLPIFQSIKVFGNIRSKLKNKKKKKENKKKKK